MTPPKLGPSTYVEDNGTKSPALIFYIFTGDTNHSPDGRYWNVNVAWIGSEGNLVSGTHQYDATTQLCFSTPPGPPWANMVKGGI